MKAVEIKDTSPEALAKMKSGKYICRRKNGSVRILTINNDVSMTDKQWKKESDVNNIVDKYVKTGQLTHLAKSQGQYADVSQVADLQDGLLKLKQAQYAFEKMPQKVREVCRSPQELVAFLDNPKNDSKAVELGLKKIVPKSDKSSGTKSVASSSAKTKDKGKENGKGNKKDSGTSKTTDS